MLSFKRVGIVSPGKVVYRKPSASKLTTDTTMTHIDTGLTHSDTGLTHSDTTMKHSDTTMKHSDTD